MSCATTLHVRCSTRGVPYRIRETLCFEALTLWQAQKGNHSFSGEFECTVIKIILLVFMWWPFNCVPISSLYSSNTAMRCTLFCNGNGAPHEGDQYWHHHQPPIATVKGTATPITANYSKG